MSWKRSTDTPPTRRTILTTGAAGLVATLSGCTDNEYVQRVTADPTLTISLLVADIVRKPPTGRIDDLTLAETALTLTVEWEEVVDTPVTFAPDLSLDGRITTPETAETEFEQLVQIDTFTYDISTTSGQQEFDATALGISDVSIPDAHSAITANTFNPTDQEHQHECTLELRLTGTTDINEITIPEHRATFDLTVTRGATEL